MSRQPQQQDRILRSGVTVSHAAGTPRAPRVDGKARLDRTAVPLSAVQAAMRQAEEAFNEAVAQASQRMQELPLQLRELLELKLLELADACGFCLELSHPPGASPAATHSSACSLSSMQTQCLCVAAALHKGVACGDAAVCAGAALRVLTTLVCAAGEGPMQGAVFATFTPKSAADAAVADAAERSPSPAPAQAAPSSAAASPEPAPAAAVAAPAITARISHPKQGAAGKAAVQVRPLEARLEHDTAAPARVHFNKGGSRETPEPGGETPSDDDEVTEAPPQRPAAPSGGCCQGGRGAAPRVGAAAAAHSERKAR